MKLCPLCGWTGALRKCPLDGRVTKEMKELQATVPQAADAHACPRCRTECPCDVAPARQGRRAAQAGAQQRACAKCDYRGPLRTCPNGCLGATVSERSLGEAVRGARADDAPPHEFPQYDESIARQLDHRCPACQFRFACPKKDSAALAQEDES